MDIHSVQVQVTRWCDESQPSPGQARVRRGGGMQLTFYCSRCSALCHHIQSYLPCIWRAVSSYSYDGHLCSLSFIIYLCEALFCVWQPASAPDSSSFLPRQWQFSKLMEFNAEAGNSLPMLRLDTVPGCCKTVSVTRKLRPLQLQTDGGARADAVTRYCV